MKPKISIITLGVADMARAVAFYRDGLGFPTHNFEDGEDFCMFRMEGTWLALYPREKMAGELKAEAWSGDGSTGRTAAVGLAHNVATEAEVDAVFALAVRVGARPVNEPAKVFWGGYSATFADPDGHFWEVAYNPFTDLS